MFYFCTCLEKQLDKMADHSEGPTGVDQRLDAAIVVLATQFRLLILATVGKRRSGLGEKNFFYGLEFCCWRLMQTPDL